MSKPLYAKIMTPYEVAEYLGLGFNKIYYLLQTKKIPAVKFGTIYRIPKEELLEAFFPCSKSVNEKQTNLLTKKELAKYLNVKMKDLEKIISKLPAVDTGTGILYSERDVQRILFNSNQ